MNDRISDALAKLADQFGVSVGKLWPFPVAHERASAIVLCAAFATVAFALAYGVRFTYKHEYDHHDEDLRWFVVIVLSASTLLAFGLSLGAVPDIIYPEAAVIKHILGK